MNRRAFGLVLAAALAGRVARAADLALSRDERALIAATLGLAPAAAADLDEAALLGRLLAFARREAGQTVRPSAIDSLWGLAPASRDLNGELRAARAAGRLADWLSDLSPPAEAYRALNAARARYATMAAAGGWPLVAEGAPLRPGQRTAAVAGLRDRLAAEGYGGAAEADPSVFDAALEAALREFQATHALEVDGVAGPATRQALNVTAAERLAQIDANLERWRWLPHRMPDDRVEIDTGAQEGVLYRGGQPVLRMRAIVGSPKHPTPMFASRIDAVVFNPPWNVPVSIARNELLPAEARRPGLLASMGIRWVDGHLQQAPGPKNSLGLVKFDIQSRYGVYLHDTPGKGLFANPVRAFSHGCMRLEKPRELAVALLAEQGGSADDVEAEIALGVTSRVALKRPPPLFVVHRTVEAGPGDRVSFRPDIYRWDRRLAAVLGPRI